MVCNSCGSGREHRSFNGLGCPPCGFFGLPCVPKDPEYFNRWHKESPDTFHPSGGLPSGVLDPYLLLADWGRCQGVCEIFCSPFPSFFCFGPTPLDREFSFPRVFAFLRHLVFHLSSVPFFSVSSYLRVEEGLVFPTRSLSFTLSPGLQTK